jgi:hypothetical protein
MKKRIIKHNTTTRTQAGNWKEADVFQSRVRKALRMRTMLSHFFTQRVHESGKTNEDDVRLITPHDEQ